VARCVGGAYTSIVHAVSAYDASQAGKTVVILAARWENPWLLVIEPRTTTRARGMSHLAPNDLASGAPFLPTPHATLTLQFVTSGLSNKQLTHGPRKEKKITYRGQGHRKESGKRCSFKRFRKVSRECAEVTSAGRAFQTRAPATEKAYDVQQ